MDIKELEEVFANFFWYQGKDLKTDEPRIRFLSYAVEYFGTKGVTIGTLKEGTMPLCFILLFAGLKTKEEIVEQTLLSKEKGRLCFKGLLNQEIYDKAITVFSERHQKKGERNES